MTSLPLPIRGEPLQQQEQIKCHHHRFSSSTDPSNFSTRRRQRQQRRPVVAVQKTRFRTRTILYATHNEDDEDDVDNKKASIPAVKKQPKKSTRKAKKTTATTKPMDPSLSSASEPKPKKRRYNTSNKNTKKKKSQGKNTNKATTTKSKMEKKKEVVAKVARELQKSKRAKAQSSSNAAQADDDSSILDMVNPFRAGKKLRETIDSLSASVVGGGRPLPSALSEEQRAIYYLSDRLGDGVDGTTASTTTDQPLFSERNPTVERLERANYVPEVLVVGATGQVGRLVVQRLLLDGRFKVRVLVPDLYSKTLNMLGTGVMYCQGDLSNKESLEFAVTDVDKIVFCVNDDDDEEDNENQTDDNDMVMTSDTDLLEKLFGPPSSSSGPGRQMHHEGSSRSTAEQTFLGLENLIQAYQDVRFADYGTSQTAKRTLFKFTSRQEDFQLFSLDYDDDDEDEDEDEDDKEDAGVTTAKLDHAMTDEVDDIYSQWDDAFEGGYDEYEYNDDDDEEGEEEEIEARNRRDSASSRSQCVWMKNKFDHAVFVGLIRKGTEVAVTSSRLRSRESPDDGIDLSNGFGGLIVRVCGDGRRYEAFVRTESYETRGVEYICEFQTDTKNLLSNNSNKSMNKYTTVRLPFEHFEPIQRRRIRGEGTTTAKSAAVAPFRGKDVRQIGFRYRSDSNPEWNDFEVGDYSSFYLALSYIKVFRIQPEPEFVYLSDALIPPVVQSNMVSHDSQELLLEEGPFPLSTSGSVQLFDDESASKMPSKRSKLVGGDSSSETYYKYRGEEKLKKSGLSYTILRISGFNEEKSGDASKIEFRSDNHDTNDDKDVFGEDEQAPSPMVTVSRTDVAQVCSSALLDPNALNKSFYMTKQDKKQQKRATRLDLEDADDISLKFASIPVDA